VGELADRLSGGERQRIGLERAFLHDSPVMLLDEPTSNLDSLNEAIILRSVLAERGRKTIVLISHRKSTVAAADALITIESGRSSSNDMVSIFTGARNR
jgi:ATP-binding cassette subfamily C protein